jgi:hypothetical protein
MTKLRANRFLLCMSSDVLHRMICRSFSESKMPRLELEDVDGETYCDVLDLWCGKECFKDKSLDAVMTMASVADRLAMTDVGLALEEAIIEQLSTGVCGDVLMGSVRLGLGRVEAAARGLALDYFEEVVESEGFMRMDEEAVGSLLDDDALRVSREEAALEAVVGWMKRGGCELRGRGLLSKIRFCVMDAEYLSLGVHRLLPAEYADWIDVLVLEALRLKGDCRQLERDSELAEARLLGAKAHVPRPRPRVQWERYCAGGERRLQGLTGEVAALAECDGRMCSGLGDGSIRVWIGSNLEHERTLRDEEDAEDRVHSLAAWEGHLISGHDSGAIQVWNLATGARDRKLEGHTRAVRCLAVSGARLVSGSSDTLMVWAMEMGAGASWLCERTIAGHSYSLAIWRGKVLCGASDSVIVWDLGTGAHEATLTGHQNVVCALAVHGDRLFSASFDGTIREWAVGTWAAVRTVEAYEQEPLTQQFELNVLYGYLDANLRTGQQIPYCLAVCGSNLISGSIPNGFNGFETKRYEVRVWDLETLECKHSLPQPPGAGVWCLAAGCGAVWGGVGQEGMGMEVVVWGRA